MSLSELAVALFDIGAFRDKSHADAIERPDGSRGFELKLSRRDPRGTIVTL